MILKAGTYRFNDVLTHGGYSFVKTSEWESALPDSGYYTNFEATVSGQSGTIGLAPFNATVNDRLNYFGLYGLVDNMYFPIYLDGVVSDNSYNNEWQNLGNYVLPREYTLPTDTEVDVTFGTWYISNTNYNEVNGGDTIYTEKSSWYKSVADAIRSKKGTTAPILRDNFASEISSITGGGETPYYDGTVIIEKPTVLGLRRWKETITPIATVNANENDVMPVEEIISQYGFEIKNPDGSNVTLSCLIDGFNGEVLVEGFGYYEPTGHESTHYLWLGKDMVIQAVPEFEVVSTANSTVDEWLLANTEGVSV